VATIAFGVLSFYCNICLASVSYRHIYLNELGGRVKIPITGQVTITPFRVCPFVLPLPLAFLLRHTLKSEDVIPCFGMVLSIVNICPWTGKK